MVQHEQISIAIVPNTRLGDGLVYMIIAHNLVRAGLKVSYYSDTMYELRSWFPRTIVLKTPRDYDSFKGVLDSHAYTIVDTPVVSDITLSHAEMGKIIVLTPAIKRARANPKPDGGATAEGLDIATCLHSLLQRDNSICTVSEPVGSIVDYTVDFCRQRLGLHAASPLLDLAVPDHLVHRSHKKRVAVFPTSPIAKKEYPRSRFLRLTAALYAKGWEPMMVVTPNELISWKQLNLNVNVVAFDDIESLASFIYETDLVISNDSGGGHLASLLEIPTVIITQHRKPFLWRPGWNEVTLIGPSMKLNLFKRKIWAPFVSQRKILLTVSHLLA